MAESTLLKSWAMPPASWPTRLHLLLLGEFALELALLGGLQRVDDGRFLVALLLLDRGDIEAAEALALAGKHRIDRRDVALALRGLPDRGFERRPVALGDDGADRTVPPSPLAAAHALEQPREQRIGAHDAALSVDGGDRHRRMMEKAHEADFRGALRIGAVVARAIEHQRARSAGRAVGAESELVKEANRQRAPAAGLEIEVEHLGLHLARSRPQRRQQGGAVAGNKVGELEAAGADLGKVLVEPIGERGVEIDDVALGIDGKEAGRRVIEIVDGVLQFLKDILLPLALAGDVAERPDGEAAGALAAAERPNLQTQPARRPALDGGDAHLFLQALAFARRLEQPVDGLGGVGIADEHALDRPHVVGARCADEIEIGGIGVDHAAVAVGDDDAVEGAVENRLDQRAAGLRGGEPQDAAGEREQREHADRGEHRQEAEDIRLGIAAAEQHDAAGGGNQHAGDQQHEDDAAAARRTPALRSIAWRAGPEPMASSPKPSVVIASSVMRRFQCLLRRGSRKRLCNASHNAPDPSSTLPPRGAAASHSR